MEKMKLHKTNCTIFSLHIEAIYPSIKYNSKKINQLFSRDLTIQEKGIIKDILEMSKSWFGEHTADLRKINTTHTEDLWMLDGCERDD